MAFQTVAKSSQMMAVESTGVDTKINYATFPKGELPYSWTNTPPTGKTEDWSNLTLNPTPTTVRDLRTLPRADIGLDRTGFDWLSYTSKLSGDDWNDERKIKEVYYQEMEDLLRAKTGARKVHIFDATICRPTDGLPVDNVPATHHFLAYAHLDQTPKAAKARVLQHLPPSEAPELLKRRVQLINIWRPLLGPVKDTPMAMADGRTLDPKKLVPMRVQHSPDRQGEVFLLQHDPNLAWYYLSDMSPNEVLLSKVYDSRSPPSVGQRDNGTAPAAPHTPFVDPRYHDDPEHAGRRESIEVRALVFTDE